MQKNILQKQINYRVFGDISKELPQKELIPYLALYIANKVNPKESLNLK